MRRDDWLLRQLPVGMVEDDFFARFVSIFQEVSSTLLFEIDTLPHMFDVATAPDTMVRTMGDWIGLDWLSAELPDSVRRRIVAGYTSILPDRGTKRGLQRLLELVTGNPVEVTDSGGVYPALEAVHEPPTVRVVVSAAGGHADHDLAHIVADEIPAYVTYELVIEGRTVHPRQGVA